VIVVAVPAVILAAASLAAFGGALIWWLDVIANFRAQFVVVLVVLGLVLMVAKWRRTGLGVFAAAAVNLVVVLPLYIGSPADESIDQPTLTVMSFNLLSTNKSYSEVIEFIRSTNPDVVLLHEASRPWEVAVDAAALDHQMIRARSDELIFGTLVLVRGEDVTAVSHGFATANPRAVEISFVPDEWDSKILLLGTHPVAPTDQERAGLRDAQLEFAGNWASRQNGFFVVAGDFNATPWSSPFRHLLDAADLRNSQSGFGLQPTFSAQANPLLRVPIDHLLHSGALEVVRRELGPALGSDHFPLLVTLQPTSSP
jgi:endonuclease/exonuclease/phosphatase (EEP) superfamily protein YafD